MKKIILFAALCALLIASNACAEKILQVDADIYKNDSVVLHKLWIADGIPSSDYLPGEYLIVVTDSEDKVLYNESIMVSFIMYFDPPVELDSAALNQKIPYTDSMNHVDIYHNDKLIFSQDIIACNNNGVCEIGTESYQTCPADCPSDKPDGVCIPDLDGVCDPDCAEGLDPDCNIVASTIPETTTTVRATTTTTSTSTTEATTSTTLPEKSGGGGLMDYFVYLIVLVVVVVAGFYGFKQYRKMQDAKIEKQREDFLKWKELQEKGGNV